MPRPVIELGRRQGLSAAELFERGLRLRPALVARQAEAERLRRLPEATMHEFHDAGILRAVQPIAFGGFEADFICQGIPGGAASTSAVAASSAVAKVWPIVEAGWALLWPCSALLQRPSRGIAALRVSPS